MGRSQSTASKAKAGVAKRRVQLKDEAAKLKAMRVHFTPCPDLRDRMKGSCLQHFVAASLPTSYTLYLCQKYI